MKIKIQNTQTWHSGYCTVCKVRDLSGPQPSLIVLGLPESYNISTLRMQNIKISQTLA